jgi:hypothetical protein
MASQHESRPQARLVRSPRLLVRVRLEHGTWRRVPIPGSCQTRLGKPSFNRYNQSTTFTGPVLLGMFAASKTNMAWRGQLDCAENCNIVRISRVGVKRAICIKPARTATNCQDASAELAQSEF